MHSQHLRDRNASLMVTEICCGLGDTVARLISITMESLRL